MFRHWKLVEEKINILDIIDSELVDYIDSETYNFVDLIDSELV